MLQLAYSQYQRYSISTNPNHRSTSKMFWTVVVSRHTTTWPWLSRSDWAAVAAGRGTYTVQTMLARAPLTHRQCSILHNWPTAACLHSWYSPAFSHTVRSAGTEDAPDVRRARLQCSCSKGVEQPTAHIRTAMNTDTYKRRLKTFLFCKFYELPLPAVWFNVMFLRYSLFQTVQLRCKSLSSAIIIIIIIIIINRATPKAEPSRKCFKTAQVLVKLLNHSVN